LLAITAVVTASIGPSVACDLDATRDERLPSKNVAPTLDGLRRWQRKCQQPSRHRDR
jgi:hypothetical protein